MYTKADEVQTYRGGTDLASGHRVKLKSGSFTTPIEVIYAGANDADIGTTEYAVLEGDLVAIRTANDLGVVEMCINDACAAYVKVYAAADGMVTPTVNGSPLGTTVEASTGVGALIGIDRGLR